LAGAARRVCGMAENLANVVADDGADDDDDDVTTPKRNKRERKQKPQTQEEISIYRLRKRKNCSPTL